MLIRISGRGIDGQQAEAAEGTRTETSATYQASAMSASRSTASTFRLGLVKSGSALLVIFGATPEARRNLLPSPTDAKRLTPSINKLMFVRNCLH